MNDPSASASPPPRLDHELILDSAALHKLCGWLETLPSVAVDTESNSMHAYRERVCLIQLTAEERHFLIDPLSVDPTPLGPLFENPAIEKIFHAAEYDVLCLRRDFNFEFRGLFDTMLAARSLAWKSLGLGKILAELYGVRLNKKMQRYDWGRRPLTQEARDYAVHDTAHLPVLRDVLAAELEEAGLNDEFASACVRTQNARPTPKKTDGERFWRVKGSNKLRPRAAARLKELYALREQLAQRKDRPPFKIGGDNELMELAQEGRSRGAFARRYRGAIEAALSRAESVEPPSPPKARPRGAKTPAELRLASLKKWRQARANARGVQSDVIVERRALEILAELEDFRPAAIEASGALDEWQFRTYAAELSATLDATPADPSRT